MLTNAIESIGNAVKSVSDCFKTFKQKQSETALLKDRNNLQKAVDVAEKIVNIMYKYLPLYLEEDAEDLQKLVKKFNKYN